MDHDWTEEAELALGDTEYLIEDVQTRISALPSEESCDDAQRQELEYLEETLGGYQENQRNLEAALRYLPIAQSQVVESRHTLNETAHDHPLRRARKDVLAQSISNRNQQNSLISTIGASLRISQDLDRSRADRIESAHEVGSEINTDSGMRSQVENQFQELHILTIDQKKCLMSNMERLNAAMEAAADANKNERSIVVQRDRQRKQTTLRTALQSLSHSIDRYLNATVNYDNSVKLGHPLHMTRAAVERLQESEAFVKSAIKDELTVRLHSRSTRLRYDITSWIREYSGADTVGEGADPEGLSNTIDRFAGLQIHAEAFNYQERNLEREPHYLPVEGTAEMQITGNMGRRFDPSSWGDPKLPPPLEEYLEEPLFLEEPTRVPPVPSGHSRSHHGRPHPEKIGQSPSKASGSGKTVKSPRKPRGLAAFLLGGKPHVSKR